MKRLSMQDFKPCPECQAKAPIIKVKGKRYYTICFECDYESKPAKNVDDAIEKWNQGCDLCKKEAENLTPANQVRNLNMIVTTDLLLNICPKCKEIIEKCNQKEK